MRAGQRVGMEIWYPAMGTITGVAPSAVSGSLNVVDEPAAIGKNTRRPCK